MHCLAITLNKKSNEILHRIGKEIFNYQNSSLVIEKFHLTLFCVDNITQCATFLRAYQEKNFLFSRMKPLKFTVLPGTTTDYDYLVVEVSIPNKIKNSIIELRRKINPQTCAFDLKPHVSIARGPKGSFSTELVELINKKYHYLAALSVKELLLFSKDFELIKKTTLSEIKAKTPSPTSI